MGFLMPQVPATPIKQPPPPDPEIAIQRDQAQSRADAAAAATGAASSSDLTGRTMGTRGARALFTGTAAGYGRTLGNANI